jgi:uncharacterized protein
MTVISAAHTPFHILAKPIGAICNLDCEYCFYLKKKDLFPESKSFRMSDSVLEEFTRQYILSQPETAREIVFSWQGGEPTLMGVDFFRKAIDYQRKYERPGMAVKNTIQTNGTLLDDRWGEFLSGNKFLVGISIDGPEEMHDKFRPDVKGNGSFAEVMRGLDILKSHRVDFNTLTCVQSHNGDYPAEVYDFLKEIGSKFMQFIPIVEKDGETLVSYRSVRPEQYGRFLAGVFDRWVEQNDVGNIFVQDFDVSLSLIMGLPSPICVHAETCGRAVAIEHNGDLFSCDHYVTREDQIGNVMTEQLRSMLDGLKQTKFGDDKKDLLPRYCRECEYLHVCNGGCPKDRLIDTPDGEPGLNYLCAGYKIFYSHSFPVFEKMAEAIRLGKTASYYKNLNKIKQDRFKKTYGAVGRNDACPCGSGRKYKKCCGVQFDSPL